jgi:hypothetical protein
MNTPIYFSLRYAKGNNGKYRLIEDLFSEAKEVIPQVLTLQKPIRIDYRQRYEYVVEGDSFISGLTQTNIRTVYMGDVRIVSPDSNMKRMVLFCFSKDKRELTIRFYPNHKPSIKLAEGEALETLVS